MYLLLLNIQQILEGWLTCQHNSVYSLLQVFSTYNEQFIIIIISQQFSQQLKKLNQKSMRKSCHQQNRKMLQAYQLFQTGQLNQSLQIYQSLLQRTTNHELRFNLICTISIISTSIGNYNYGLQILQHNFNGLMQSDFRSVNILVQIRYMANMCFLYILMGMFEEAVQMFNRVKSIVRTQDVDKKHDIIELLVRLFFRVGSINEIEQQIDVKNKVSLLQALYMLNIAMARDFLSMPNAQKLLKSSYPIFISHKKFHLAVVCIRQLLLLPLCNKQITKYEKQLSKIISMDLMQNYQIDNKLSMECCKYIAHELINLVGQIQVSKKEYCADQQDNFLWEVVLRYQDKKLKNGALEQQQRNAISKNIQMMLQQQNSLVIREMKKTDFYVSAERQIKHIIHSFSQTCESFLNYELLSCWKKMQTFCQKTNSKMIRNKSQSQMSKNNTKTQKQNRLPIAPISLTRQYSSKSLIIQKKKENNQNQNDKSFSIIALQQKQKVNNQNKLLYKMLKFCEYGSFLNKRNFNSDGGEYRFVRVTQSVLKWAKNPQKIEESHQLYPLKDIKSIVYGKCTPTLLKPTNNLLKEQFCFSLNLKKRTLDFYCKDFQQTSNWVCGLSHKLKQLNPQCRVYTKGRMLWKKMFMVLRQNFTNNIKNHQRKFYYQTAQAIILFGRNGYKLNTK